MKLGFREHLAYSTIKKDVTVVSRLARRFTLVTCMLLQACSEEEKIQDYSQKGRELIAYGEKAKGEYTLLGNFSINGITFFYYHSENAQHNLRYDKVKTQLQKLEKDLGGFTSRPTHIRILSYDTFDLPPVIRTILDGVGGSAVHGLEEGADGIVFLEENSTEKELFHELLHVLTQIRSFQLSAPEILVEGPVYMYADPKESFENIPMKSENLYQEMEGLFSKSLELSAGRGFMLKKDVAARFFYDIHQIDPGCLQRMTTVGVPEILTPETIRTYILEFTNPDKHTAMSAFLEKVTLFDGTEKELYFHPMIKDNKISFRYATASNNYEDINYDFEYYKKGISSGIRKKIHQKLSEDMIIRQTETLNSGFDRFCVDGKDVPKSCLRYDSQTGKFY